MHYQRYTECINLKYSTQTLRSSDSAKNLAVEKSFLIILVTNNCFFSSALTTLT